MTQTKIQKSFAPLRRLLPQFLSNSVRSIFTASLTPILFSYKTGHFRSSFQMAAVSRKGDPLPWYTYPCIDFLKYRDYQNKTILEFGGGQSTLWWANRSKYVLTFEGDEQWYKLLKRRIPENVDLHLVPMENPTACLNQVNSLLSEKGDQTFDVIIIDGLYRYEIIEVARNVLNEHGVIICDNAEGYGFYDGFKNSGMNRVDFFGHTPGVVLPHCTSLFFKEDSFIFSSEIPIPVVAHE